MVNTNLMSNTFIFIIMIWYVVPNNLLIYLKTSSGFKTQCWYLSLDLLCYKSTMRSIDIPCSQLNFSLFYSTLWHPRKTIYYRDQSKVLIVAMKFVFFIVMVGKSPGSTRAISPCYVFGTFKFENIFKTFKMKF